MASTPLVKLLSLAWVASTARPVDAYVVLAATSAYTSGHAAALVLTQLVGPVAPALVPESAPELPHAAIAIATAARPTSTLGRMRRLVTACAGGRLAFRPASSRSA